MPAEQPDASREPPFGPSNVQRAPDFPTPAAPEEMGRRARKGVGLQRQLLGGTAVAQGLHQQDLRQRFLVLLAPEAALADLPCFVLQG
mmetsp:Transcript_40447/g.53246  ORF Transcript_40447/g.53246 Transcript_40447/m.53246 type:complete len:88 (-) Transcript_40447:103-366(-)